MLRQVCCIVKSHAFEAQDDVLTALRQVFVNGYLQMSIVHTVPPDLMPAFYAEHVGRAYYGRLLESVSGPLVFVLALTDDIAAARQALGPTDPEQARRVAPQSVRARFGTVLPHNAVHMSDSAESGAREIALLRAHGVMPACVFAQEETGPARPSAGLSAGLSAATSAATSTGVCGSISGVSPLAKERALVRDTCSSAADDSTQASPAASDRAGSAAAGQEAGGQACLKAGVKAQDIYDALCVVAESDWSDHCADDANRMLEKLDIRRRESGGGLDQVMTDLRADIVRILVSSAGRLTSDASSDDQQLLRGVAAVLQKEVPAFVQGAAYVPGL